MSQYFQTMWHAVPVVQTPVYWIIWLQVSLQPPSPELEVIL